MDEESEIIKRKKLEQLKNQLEASQTEEDAEDDYKQEKEALLRSLLTPEARERLGRVRVARPEVAEGIEQQIMMLAQRGMIKGKIDDDTLKKLLKKITDNQKVDFTIRRR
ncbi:MAG: DNA-binding protein [Thermoplasmata archaeon]